MTVGESVSNFVFLDLLACFAVGTDLVVLTIDNNVENIELLPNGEKMSLV